MKLPVEVVLSHWESPGFHLLVCTDLIPSLYESCAAGTWMPETSHFMSPLYTAFVACAGDSSDVMASGSGAGLKERGQDSL